MKEIKGHEDSSGLELFSRIESIQLEINQMKYKLLHLMIFLATNIICSTLTWD